MTYKNHTADSDSANLGSNPSPPANPNKVAERPSGSKGERNENSSFPSEPQVQKAKGDDLTTECGLASIIRSLIGACAPGHHGYQRACECEQLPALPLNGRASTRNGCRPWTCHSEETIQ